MILLSLVVGILLVIASFLIKSGAPIETAESLPPSAEMPVAPLKQREEPAEILFGCSISLTGRLRNEGRRVVEGYDFIVERTNREGGVKVGGKRYPLRIIYYDDRSEVAQVRANITRLITEDQVDFLLGPFSSALTLAASKVAESHGVILVEPCGASEVIFSYGARATFGTMTTAGWYLRDFFRMIAEKAKTPQTYAVICMDKLFPKSVAKGARIWGTKYGLEEIYYAAIPPESDNWLLYLEELSTKSPDVVVFAGHYLDSVNFAHQLHTIPEYQPKAVVLTLGPTQRQFVTELGSKAEYIAGISQWSSQSDYACPFFGSSQKFAAKFKSRYGVAPTYQNAQAAASILIYRMALEQCSALDAGQVLEKIRLLDADIFYGKIRFNSRGMNIGKEMVVVQIQDSKPELVWSYGPTAKPLIYPIPHGAPK